MKRAKKAEIKKLRDIFNPLKEPLIKAINHYQTGIDAVYETYKHEENKKEQDRK